MLYDIPVQTKPIGNGDQGVRNTLAYMRKLINAGVHNWEVRYAAAQLVRDAPERNPVAEITALFEYIQQFSRYTMDPFNIELLHSPEESLRLIREDGFAALDCDDGSILFSSLAKSIGYPVRLKVISTNPDRQFNHVYSQVWIRGNWVSADTIRKDRPLGWEAPNQTRSMTVEV